MISQCSTELTTLSTIAPINAARNPRTTNPRTNIEATHSWQWIKGRHSLTWGAS